MNPFYELVEYVDAYIYETKNIDGMELIEILSQFLPNNSSVLELGMGAGKDLKILAEKYAVVGSDYSTLFIKKFKATNPNTSILWLDAIHIATSLTFDCLYSNKVLQHLSPTELEKSLLRQTEVLNKNGLVCHSFLHGTEKTERNGIIISQYQKEDLVDIFEMNYKILYSAYYTEAIIDDSILVIAKKLD